MQTYKAAPFYKTYPIPLSFEQEDEVNRDLNYLQQIYPLRVKDYQKVVVQVMDRYDFQGSFIYDEYPDKRMLDKVGNEILLLIKQREGAAEMLNPPEKWEWITYLLQMLISMDLFRRRHRNDRGVLRF